MDPAIAAREAQTQADKTGYQFVVVDDPIGQAEDSDNGTAAYMPTLAITTCICSLRHGGRILQVIEPKNSAPDRRKDLEDGLVELFKTDPARIAEHFR